MWRASQYNWSSQLTQSGEHGKLSFAKYLCPILYNMEIPLITVIHSLFLRSRAI
jgi:hypothetical protein